MPRNRCQDEWDKANSITVSIRFMRRTEADILLKLEGQENKSAYIKALIRKDIKAERKNDERP